MPGDHRGASETTARGVTERDRKRLGASDARLIAAVDLVLMDMAAAGSPMFVVSGARTTGEQIVLYAQGRTTPGVIVTKADGVHVKSNHQRGRAADCAFVDTAPFAESHPWKLYADTAQRYGLVAGYYWKTPDRPHVELPELPEGTLVT